MVRAAIKIRSDIQHNIESEEDMLYLFIEGILASTQTGMLQG